MKKRYLIEILTFIFLLLGITNISKATSSEKTYLWVDTPSYGATLNKGKIEISGWVMSEAKNLHIQIFVDNQFYENIKPERREREDVLKAIHGYGDRNTSPKPGFYANVDLSKISSGNHVIMIRVLKEDNYTEIARSIFPITIKTFDTMLWVDNPTNNSSKFDELYISGWIMSWSRTTELKAYIDGNLINANFSRRLRGDVINAIKGYGGSLQNKTPGYELKLDISNLNVGQHKLRIEAYGENQVLLTSQNLSFRVRTPDNLLCIDYPGMNKKEKSSIYVQGWVMSEDEQNKVEISINGKKYGVTRYERPDVIDAVKGYGGYNKNPQPGYKANIDVSAIKDGSNEVQINVYSRKGELLQTQKRKIYIKKYETLLQFDTPSENQRVKEYMDVTGWVMSETQNHSVEITVNGRNISPDRQERADVIKAVKGYGGTNNTKPGYCASIDMSDAKDGNYQIIVKVKDNITGEILAKQTKNIYVHKYNGIMVMDYPKVTMINNNSINIEGWAMTEDSKSNVHLYIDNKLINSKMDRKERKDVIEAVKDYGGIGRNPKPGYIATVDVSKYSEGKHVIKVDVVSRTGDILSSVQRTIQIYRNTYFGIDVSIWQGNIDFDALMSTKRLDFMIARTGYYSENNKKLIIDEQFERNYSQAKLKGLPIGTYLYSYAMNVEQAKREAESLVQYFKSTQKTFELPVFYDIEDKTQNNISKEEQTKMCIEFGETLKKAGYKVGIYTSANWFKNNINLEQIPGDYDIWVSRYGKNDGSVPIDGSQFPGNHDIWQYTSSGKIDGINSNVDFDIAYKKY